MIYLDNAATSLQKPKEVEEEIIRALHTMGNPGRGAHDATLQAGRCVYQVREQLAQLFNAESADCIAFTSNATEALNTAILGLFQKGDHVITTVCEHNSVLRPLYRLQKQGVEVSFLSADEQGILDYDKLPALIKENTKAVIVTHASNLTGNITDLECIKKEISHKDILLIADASQTAGILPIEVQKMGIDVLCFTGHKGLMGPQGTGGMYVKSGVKIRPLLSGGSGIDSYNMHHPSQMPEALEAGTLNGHGIAGLRAALSFLEREGMERLRKRELELMRRFYNGVAEIPNVKVYGDFRTDRRAAIVSLNIGDYDSAEISDELSGRYGIVTRSGAHCAPLMHEALGTKIQGAVRFSFSHYNTEEEIDEAIRAVKELAGE